MKYDWPLMRQDYIVGDIADIQVFFKEVFGKFAPTKESIRKNTKGWEKDRHEYQTALKKRLNDIVVEKQTKMHLEHLRKMLETKDKLIELVQEYFSEGNAYEYVYYTDPVTGEKKKKIKLLISSTEFKNMWQIIKTEVGEPVNIPAEKEKQAKISIPKDGVFGLKQLMVRWKQENGQVKQLEGEVLEGESLNNEENEDKDDTGETKADAG